MPGLDQERIFLSEAVAGLGEYLISDNLFGGLSLPATGIRSAALSRLTLGNLLLVQARLQAFCQPAPEDRASHAQEVTAAEKGKAALCAELVRQEAQITALHRRWPANWERKVLQELPVRLKSWVEFLSEYWNDRPAQARVYPSQVRLRTILALLASERVDLPPGFQSQLDLMDQRLKGDLIPGPFVWEPNLAGGFPPGPFWYLYGRLWLA